MTRNEKEMHNLFADPKYSRKAWESVGKAILERPAKRLPEQYDKDGNPTYSTLVEEYSYDALKKDLDNLVGSVQGKEQREPTELEMLLQCQIVKARHDTSAATFIRDTVGAKPVDQSKVETNVNVYEDLTDEELELLVQHRAAKEASSPAATPQSLVDADSNSDNISNDAQK